MVRESPEGIVEASFRRALTIISRILPIPKRRVMPDAQIFTEADKRQKSDQLASKWAVAMNPLIGTDASARCGWHLVATIVNVVYP